MPTGNSACFNCQWKPWVRFTTCGHTTCEKHYYTADADDEICAWCRKSISSTTEIPTPPSSIGPILLGSNIWTPHRPLTQTKTLCPIEEASEDSSPTESGGVSLNSSRVSEEPRSDVPSFHQNLTNFDTAESAGDTFKTVVGITLGSARGRTTQKKIAFADPPSTPTRAPRSGTTKDKSKMPNMPAYQPPHRRTEEFAGLGAGLIRSNSKADGSVQRADSPSPTGSDPAVTSGGHYRHAPRMSQLEVFNNTYHTPTKPRSPFNSKAMNGQQQTPIRTPIRTPARTPDSSNASMEYPSKDMPYDLRALSLANMIKAGMMDDPRDIDYGNPGPSRRANPPNVSPSPKKKTGEAGGSPSKDDAKIPQIKGSNIEGNAAAFLGTREMRLPEWFPGLARGILPTVEDVMNNIPLCEPCRVAKPSSAGVIQITNMPYNTTRSEVVAMLGNNAKICAQPPGSPFYAVHILMDRQSGKTLDCYVEVESVQEAKTLVRQMAQRVTDKRPPKLGDRIVEVKLSSQDYLLTAAFPHGKNVSFKNGKPVIKLEREEFYPGVYSTGFTGFLQEEEIYAMSKHADTPQRSPFAQRCLIRTYECMITTLYKYPWYATDNILETERGRLYESVYTTIRSLINLLQKIKGNRQAERTKPSTDTLKELAVAALVCPGFSEKEKYGIVAVLVGGGYHQLTKPLGMSLRFGGNHHFSADWPFRVAVKQPGTHDDVVEYFASLMRDATRPEQEAIGRSSAQFGTLIISYEGAKTLADYARCEVKAVQDLLARVLPRRGNALISNS